MKTGAARALKLGAWIVGAGLLLSSPELAREIVNPWRRPPHIDPLPERTPASVTSARDVKPKIDDSPIPEPAQAAKLEEGDTIRYRGQTLIKMGPNDGARKEDLDLMAERWRREVAIFLQQETAGRVSADELFAARQNSFAEYNEKNARLEQEVLERFGPSFGIALDGELKKIHDAADASYQRKLAGLLRPGERERFEELRENFFKQSAEQIRGVPDEVW